MEGELQRQKCDIQQNVPQGQTEDDPNNISTLINDVRGGVGGKEKGVYRGGKEWGHDNERISAISREGGGGLGGGGWVG